MNIQHLHTTARFSEATIHQGIVYLAGQLASHLDANIEQQTHETLAIIDQLLAETGSHKSHILSCTIYLNDIQQDYAAFNLIWDEWLREVKAPPRTCIQAGLYRPDVLIEISIIAAQIE